MEYRKERANRSKCGKESHLESGEKSNSKKDKKGMEMGRGAVGRRQYIQYSSNSRNISTNS